MRTTLRPFLIAFWCIPIWAMDKQPVSNSQELVSVAHFNTPATEDAPLLAHDHFDANSPIPPMQYYGTKTPYHPSHMKIEESGKELAALREEIATKKALLRQLPLGLFDKIEATHKDRNIENIRFNRASGGLATGYYLSTLILTLFGDPRADKKHYDPKDNDIYIPVFQDIIFGFSSLFYTLVQPICRERPVREQ